MRKQLATAVLAMSLTPPAQALCSKTFASGRAAAAPRHQSSTHLNRHLCFGDLPWAGRFCRRELARFSIEDGRLLAEWAGYMRAARPCRVDTPELDAEWMACGPGGLPGTAGHWYLARRELQPGPDGRLWTISVSGHAHAPDRIRIVASATGIGAAEDAMTLRFEQKSSSAKLLLFSGRAANPWLSAKHGSVTELMARYSDEVQQALMPAIRRISDLELV